MIDRTPRTCPSKLRVAKRCAECRTQFVIAPNIADRYVTCSDTCSRSRRSRIKLSEGNPNWLGEATKPESKRARGRRRFVLPAKCERCNDAPPIDRHHKDSDTGNNERSNIAFLCRRCHMLEDGRLAKFVRRRLAS